MTISLLVPPTCAAPAVVRTRVRVPLRFVDGYVSTADVHTFHHLGMWVVVVYIIIHIYAAIREDIMSRQSIISTMISGERMFKDNRP